MHFYFQGEFTKNELCLLIALFICTVCIVLVPDSVKELCKSALSAISMVQFPLLWVGVVEDAAEYQDLA